MTLLVALCIIEVHGHGHYLTVEKQDLLHEARKAVVKHANLVEKTYREHVHTDPHCSVCD